MNEYDPAIIWTPEQRQAAQYCIDLKITVHSMAGVPLLSVPELGLLFQLRHTLCASHGALLSRTDLLNL